MVAVPCFCCCPAAGGPWQEEGEGGCSALPRGGVGVSGCTRLNFSSDKGKEGEDLWLNPSVPHRTGRPCTA